MTRRWYDAWIALLVLGLLGFPVAAVLEGWGIIESGAFIGVIGAAAILGLWRVTRGAFPQSSGGTEQ